MVVNASIVIRSPVSCYVVEAIMLPRRFTDVMLCGGVTDAVRTARQHRYISLFLLGQVRAASAPTGDPRGHARP